MQYDDTVSIYAGTLTNEVALSNIVKIKAAFPALPGSFYDVLSSRLIDKGFCDTRLNDAVNHVIDNCIYPTPSIAEFISFDRTIKVKTHEEMCKEAMTYEQIWDTWLPIKFPELPKVLWVHANDIEKYKLTQYRVKQKQPM